jgi:hypothetical protein
VNVGEEERSFPDWVRSTARIGLPTIILLVGLVGLLDDESGEGNEKPAREPGRFIVEFAAKGPGQIVPGMRIDYLSERMGSVTDVTTEGDDLLVEIEVVRRFRPMYKFLPSRLALFRQPQTGREWLVYEPHGPAGKRLSPEEARRAWLQVDDPPGR